MLSSLAKAEEIHPGPGWNLLDVATATPSGAYEVAPTNERLFKLYVENLWVFTAITTNARAIAGAPWQLKRWNESTGQGDIVTDHPMIDLLEKPYEGATYETLIQTINPHLDLAGNAYLEEVGSEGADQKQERGPILELRPLLPTKMRSIIHPRDGVEKYVYTPNMNPTQLSPDEVIHFILQDPRSEVNGIGPASAGWLTARIDQEALRWNAGFFARGATPGVVLETPEKIPAAERTRIVAEFDSKFGGTDKAHKTACLPYGLKATPFGQTMREMQFRELRKMTREEILAVFGTPPILCGLLDGASYSNAYLQLQIFRDYHVLPRLRYVFAMLTAALAPRYEDGAGLYLEPDVSEMRLPDEEDRELARAVQLVNAKIIDVDEARTMIGLAPREVAAEATTGSVDGTASADGAKKDVTIFMYDQDNAIVTIDEIRGLKGLGPHPNREFGPLTVPQLRAKFPDIFPPGSTPGAPAAAPPAFGKSAHGSGLNGRAVLIAAHGSRGSGRTWFSRLAKHAPHLLAVERRRVVQVGGEGRQPASGTPARRSEFQKDDGGDEDGGGVNATIAKTVGADVPLTPWRLAKAKDAVVSRLEPRTQALLQARLDRQKAKVLALIRGKLQKGDVEGHEFHGNQWTGGGAASFSITPQRPSVGTLPTLDEFKARIGPDGNVIEGHIGKMPVTTSDRGLIQKLTNKTKAAIETSFGKPEIQESLNRAGIRNVRVEPTKGSGKPDHWTAGMGVDRALIIHPRTQEYIDNSTNEDRRSGGLDRVIHHEAGHAVWDQATQQDRKLFSDALAEHPEVSDRVGKIVNLAAPRDAFNETKDRTVSEAHAEVQAMRIGKHPDYAGFHEDVRNAVERIWVAKHPRYEDVHGKSQKSTSPSPISRLLRKADDAAPFVPITEQELRDAIYEPLLSALTATLEQGLQGGADSMAGALGITARVEGGDFMVPDADVQAYLEERKTNLEDVLDEATARGVKDALKAGYDAGESEKDIMARIAEAGEFGEARARNIARTELHAATQSGAFEQMKAAGIERVQWLASPDERTRDSHREASGQIQDVGTPFDVGDAQLMYPGDPDGPPEEICQCRCILLSLRSSDTGDDLAALLDRVDGDPDAVDQVGEAMRALPDDVVARADERAMGRLTVDRGKDDDAEYDADSRTLTVGPKARRRDVQDGVKEHLVATVTTATDARGFHNARELSGLPDVADGKGTERERAIALVSRAATGDRAGLEEVVGRKLTDAEYRQFGVLSSNFWAGFGTKGPKPAVRTR